MYCTKCGNPVEENAKFCSKCGTAIQATSEDNIAPAPQAPVYEAPQAPVYEAPQAPAYEAPAYEAPQVPVYEAPQAPVYEAPQAPAYQTPVYQPAPPAEENKAGKIFSLISMLCGIFSLVFCWIPFYLMLTPSMAAIALGILGIIKKGNKGKCIPGIVLGAVAFLFITIISAAWEAAM